VAYGLTGPGVETFALSQRERFGTDVAYEPVRLGVGVRIDLARERRAPLTIVRRCFGVCLSAWSPLAAPPFLSAP
jgi:hypothetical protein